MSDDGHDPALIGRTIAGKFVVEKHLGGGAMGAVYRARQTALEKNVAVKVLHREVAHDAQFKARFHREAKAASRLDHPNSMRVIDFGEEPDGLLYIAMEYLEGRDLYRVIHEDWPISDARIVDILSQALAAIAVAHDMGVIHRDLKPENIMVLRGRDDEGHAADVVKVCDFGIAKIQEPEDAAAPTAPAPGAGAGPNGTQPGPLPEGKKLTTQGLVVGTPEYMSPEQARGEKLDARSDIYSMGVILFQLLTGRTPFTGDTALAIVLKHITEQPPAPRSIYAGVNATLEAICVKAMSKAPGDRFQTAREMRSALRAIGEGRPTPVDVSAPTIIAPSAPVITAATTGPTLAELPAITTTNAGATAEARPAPPAKRSNAVVVVALMAVIGAAAGTAVLLSKKDAPRDERSAKTTSSAMRVDSSNVTPPPPSTVAINTANPSPVSHDTASPPIEAKIEKRHEHGGKSPIKTVGVDTTTVPDPPAPPTAAPPDPPPPSPPPTPTVTAPATTEAPPAPTPPPAPAFNSATCRANQGSVAPHGVSMKDLTMRGTADAWTACAKSTIKERPVTPISASVHIQFSDSRQFRGATCAGCPAPLAACVAANTGKTVSLQFKSGDVLGDPSFDVGVTFTCD